MNEGGPFFLGPGTILALFLFALAGPVEAQAPLFLVNTETTVASVHFRFPDGQSLEEGVLRKQITLSGPTFGHKVRGFLSHLPLVSPRIRFPSARRNS